MPEYLAPGVYVEEVSFRSKSIEGVSTTTTGFVGPARYGPTEIEPDVLTSVLDFERVHGDRRQLVWSGDQYHNFLWHAVRAFFEEGGKRLYVSRVFKPLKDKDGEELTAAYDPPAPRLQDDRAKRSAGKLYEQDGHARLWLTKETAALSAIAEALQETLTTINETQAQSALAKLRAENAARLAKEPGGAGDATAATKRSAEKAQNLFSTVDSSFDATTATEALAVNALPTGTLPNDLLDASSSARDMAKTAIDEAALGAAGALQPATSTDAVLASGAVVDALGDVVTDASAAATNATAAKNAANASSISAAVKAAFVVAETEVLAAQTIVAEAVVLSGTAQTNAGQAGTAYENANANAPARAQTAETSALNLASKVDEAVAQVVDALGRVTEAQTMSSAEIGLPDAVRSAAALSKDAAEKLLASARKTAAAAQDFRGQATGALARANAVQALLAMLGVAVTNVNAAATEYTDNAVVKAQDAQDAVASATTCSQLVIDAVAAAKTAVDDAKAAADAASLAVADVRPAVILAKTALDLQAGDAGAKVQAAKDKATAATLSLDDLVSKAAAATSKTAGVVNLPDFTLVSPNTVKTKITAATTFAATAEGLVAPAVTSFADAAAEVNKLPGNLTGAAADAAANSAGIAVSGLQALEEALQIAVKIVQDEETQLAETVALFAGALTDGGLPQEAVLLRARFPGIYGNLMIRFSLRVGQNLLRGKSGNAQAPGLQPGDFVWIGNQPVPGATVESGDLLLATTDEETQEWRFGPDTEKANLTFWLNRGTDNLNPQLDPATQFLRVATIAVTVTPNDGTPETWEGLSPQPTHTRAGAPDSLTAKFRPEPASRADARLLPLVILTDDSITTAGALFKTLFGRLGTTLELPHGYDRLEIDLALAGGNDGQRPGADEYEGREKDHGKTGLMALEDIDDISIVATPGATYGLNDGYRSNAEAIFGLVISHAERMRYRIAVLDSGNNQTIGEVRATCAKLDSKYAAIYYPWVKILDPVTRQEIHLPPSGFVTGIYARNDITRAVYKAPANEVVNLALGFEITLNKSQQDVLNPEGINCFRFFPGRGYRLWGARLLCSDPEWKYVNLRRYFAYVEHSIDKGTQWAVFEPNGERLWDNVRRTIYDFLLNEWQSGALLGEKPEKAFFVRCDRSTMTQNDLDNGRLVCLIGIVPLRPAEYVIFRIGQWTADHKV